MRYSINKTVGDWNVWWVASLSKPRWSNEFPDAFLMSTRDLAEKALAAIKAAEPNSNASICEETE